MIRGAILKGGYDLERCWLAISRPKTSQRVSRTARVGPTEGFRTGSIAGTRILRATIVLPARLPAQERSCIDGIDGHCVSQYDLRVAIVLYPSAWTQGTIGPRSTPRPLSGNSERSGR